MERGGAGGWVLEDGMDVKAGKGHMVNGEVVIGRETNLHDQ